MYVSLRAAIYVEVSTMCVCMWAYLNRRARSRSTVENEVNSRIEALPVDRYSYIHITYITYIHTC
jgi:hypothetical protein